MKLIFLAAILFCSSCTNHEEKPSDDYVLIEFASKLEEEYQKLEPKNDTSREP